MAIRQREIETKFDVAPDFVPGDLTELTQAGQQVRTDTVELVSAYHDTADHALLRSRLTLRRRTGDDDTGWQLKVPGDGFRTELHWPLGEADRLPEELRELLSPWLRDGAVAPIATLKVIRTRSRVLTADGVLVFELADDEVRASAPHGQIAAPRWRELEVELGPAGTPEDLLRAGAVLRAHGAYPPASASKLGRALRGITLAEPSAPTAASVVGDYIRTQCDALTEGHFAIADKAFSADAGSEPHEAIHQTRVAARRLRAALRVFADLFEPRRAALLERELRWYAAELGEIRDREVLRSRMSRAVDDLPAFLIVGPVGERIDGLLLSELHVHADELAQTMRGDRYAALIADLADWCAKPPFTEAADRPAGALADFVAAADRTLTRRMKHAAHRLAPDEELHSARKAGKRARYAAEAAEPVLGKRAHRLAKAASTLQTLLGEHQDAVVATELLRRVADQVADEGGNAFTYGILVADERRTAAETAEAARRSAQSRLPNPN